MKKIIVLLISLVAVVLLLVYEIKTVPNYTNERGYDIVSRSDYEKYNQGYCLTENRILPEEEILKKALKQYFEKDIVIDQKIEDFRIQYYGSGQENYWRWKSNEYSKKYNFQRPTIAYYALDNVSIDNFAEKFIEKYDKNNKKTGLLEVFFGEFKAKKINPMDLIEIKGKEAYFPIPVVFFGRSEQYSLYSRKFYLNKDDGYTFMSDYFFFTEGYPFNVDIKQEQILRKEDKYWNYSSNKVDNCGNIDLDVEEIYEEVKFLTGG